MTALSTSIKFAKFVGVIASLGIITFGIWKWAIAPFPVMNVILGFLLGVLLLLSITRKHEWVEGGVSFEDELRYTAGTAVTNASDMGVPMTYAESADKTEFGLQMWNSFGFAISLLSMYFFAYFAYLYDGKIIGATSLVISICFSLNALERMYELFNSVFNKKLKRFLNEQRFYALQNFKKLHQGLSLIMIIWIILAAYMGIGLY